MSPANVLLPQPTTAELETAAAEFGAAKSGFAQMYKKTMRKLKGRGAEIGGDAAANTDVTDDAGKAPTSPSKRDNAKAGGDEVGNGAKKKRNKKGKQEAVMTDKNEVAKGDNKVKQEAAMTEAGKVENGGEWELV
jgi:hypothetical protein